jgi:hypothetical protein
MNAINHDINHINADNDEIKQSTSTDSLNITNTSETPNLDIKLKCMICYDEIINRYSLECCKTPTVCLECINYLVSPICPFCRSPILSLMDDPKYRLSSSCPTYSDHLSDDLIRNMVIVSYDDRLHSNHNIRNRSNSIIDSRIIRQYNRERRMNNVMAGNIRPYSRSRANSDHRQEINEGLNIYYSELNGIREIVSSDSINNLERLNISDEEITEINNESTESIIGPVSGPVSGSATDPDIDTDLFTFDL